MEAINLPFTSDNVEKALVEFYSPTSQFKPQLDVWLKQAQVSSDAWHFSWSLLDDKKVPEIQFFGASCLYNKVSKSFSDIPLEQYDSLKNKLLEKLIFYANQGPNLRLIQRKLNSALAKLALQLLPDEWDNCIDDIIQTIPNLTAANIPSSQLILIVVDLLTLLAEEFSSLNVIKGKKASIRHFLLKNFDKVKNYLQNLFNSNATGSSLVECGIKCLSSWGEFGVYFDQMNIFVNFLFASIYNDALFDASCDCLTSMFTLPENQKFIASIFTYLPQILNLGNLLKNYVESKDTDGCVVLTKLILSFGENQIKNIIEVPRLGDNQAKSLVFSLINMILTLTSIPGNFPIDEESTDLTFVFWYTFQDELLGLDETGHLKEIFKPIFINLLEIFIIKLQLGDSYDQWTEDEKERLRCYRIDIGDTMVYMIAIVGDIMMEYIIKRLVDAISKKFDWKIQEALIYMLQSVVTELNESTNVEYNCSNDSCILEFINVLPSINYCNKHILSTTLMAIGSLGNWLERNTFALPNIISLCLLGLKTESVTQSASFALKDIINDCDLSQYADQIISTCQECLKFGFVQQAHNYEVRLMSIIGLSISDILAVDMQRAITWVASSIQPYLNQLEEFTKMTHFDKQAQTMLGHILNMFSQLLSSLSSRSQHDSLVIESTDEQKSIVIPKKLSYSAHTSLESITINLDYFLSLN